MDFQAFDKSRLAQYAEEAKRTWGGSAATEIIIFKRQKFLKVIVKQSNGTKRQSPPLAVVSSNSKPLDTIKALCQECGLIKMMEKRTPQMT